MIDNLEIIEKDNINGNYEREQFLQTSIKKPGIRDVTHRHTQLLLCSFLGFLFDILVMEFPVSCLGILSAKGSEV